ncbi:hypothetical protein J2Z83_003070 [Virgibacillus natechei]|uniref:Uncharacterized protein n=1 Tax=Virgibacillus natechei TaxID=1216297 RepID=A0ABS4IJ31_9BACI|nr:hypothetical protein [Virgibacillus natechei]MBP1970934.1 hypothetical protein [Virgibacillus natechei]UZD13311.1 hypothetical protein OLD84_01715 [Virgibacillus natechei]
MKVNKNIILVICIVIFFIVATYFIEPTEGNDSPGESDNVTNIENENEKLKQDIEHLEESLFEAEKYIYDSELASDYLPFAEKEIIYKEIEERKYVILYKSEVGGQIENHLLVVSDKPNFKAFLTVPSLNPTNGITMDYIGDAEYNYFGGIITDKEVKKVQVLQNEKVHEANIFKVDEDIYGWYSIFERDDKDRRDKLRIEALDENDVILWQESIR